MIKDMSVEDNLSNLKDYLEMGKYEIVIKESCTIFEMILKKLISQAISELPRQHRDIILDSEREIGKNKEYRDFTFGQLVGLCRESNLIQLWSQYTNKNLGLIKSMDLAPIVELRNELTHGNKSECNAYEARLVYEYLMNWLAFFGYSDLEVNISSAFKKRGQVVYEQEEVEKKVLVQDKKRLKSVYSSSYGAELERLKIQAKNSEAVDLKAFEYTLKYLEQQHDLVGIDIGCASGVVTHSRFSKFNNFRKVIGFDFNKENVKRANEMFADDRFKFYYLDVESDSFERDIKEILKENDCSCIDVAFSALTVHHLKNPEKFLRKLRRIISKNGTIILRGSDDGSKICNPDAQILIDIIAKTLEAKGVSDRLNGRKLYTQLYKSGYRNIKMMYQIKDTSQLDIDERYNLFFESFMYRKDYFEKQLNADPTNIKYNEDYEWICSALEDLEELFASPEFYYSEMDVISIGFK